VTPLDLDSLGAPREIEALLEADRVLMFGAGNASREMARYLRDQGKTIAAYLDNDPARAGSQHDGAEVLPPDAVHQRELRELPIVVSTEAQAEVGTQLLETLGVPRTRVFSQVSYILRGHYRTSLLREHRTDLEWLLGRVADDESRAYLDGLIRVRWTMDPSHSRRNAHVRGQYLYDHPDTAPDPGDVIVDCGAYTGDTARDFLERLRGDASIHALEPFPPNFAMVETLAKTFPPGTIVPWKVAAGAAKATATLVAPGEEPSMYPRIGTAGAAGIAVAVERLDDLFAFTRVDYLKMDIEGAETDAIRGGAALIARDRPTMVIASYHRPDDLWAIPRLVESIEPRFRLYAGHNHGTVHEVELYFVFD
jgi:FkbM family methyltransferase